MLGLTHLRVALPCSDEITLPSVIAIFKTHRAIVQCDPITKISDSGYVILSLSLDQNQLTQEEKNDGMFKITGVLTKNTRKLHYLIPFALKDKNGLPAPYSAF